jgi:hypothetical protein
MDSQEAAKKILADIEAAYKPTHEYVAVDEREFSHLDLKFYRETARWLEGNDFVQLEDKEDVTLARTPGNVLRRVMIRVLRLQDGTIMASLYHPKLRSWWLQVLLVVLGKRLGRIVDFESEFSDGSFVCTSNAMAAASIQLPPLIHVEYLPVRTPVAQVLARHRERVAAHLQQHPGVMTRRAMSADDVRRAQNRMNALKAAFRGEIGGVSLEELRRLAPNAEIADRVYAAIQKQRTEDGAPEKDGG